MIEVLTDGLVDANKVVVGLVLGLIAVATLTYLVHRLWR
jgi:hypothetical protein